MQLSYAPVDRARFSRESSDYQWRDARRSSNVCRECIGKDRGKKRSRCARRWRKCNRSRELEIESNFLGLALSPPPFSFLRKPTIILSPWPRIQVKFTVGVFLSFSFHFPFTLLTLLYVCSTPLFLPFSHALSLSLSLLHGAPLNLRSLRHLCKRYYTIGNFIRTHRASCLPSNAIPESYYVSVNGTDPSVRERPWQLVRVPVTSCARFAEPNSPPSAADEPRWTKVREVDTSSRISLVNASRRARRLVLYGCSLPLDELLFVVNMDDARVRGVCATIRKGYGDDDFLDV